MNKKLKTVWICLTLLLCGGAYAQKTILNPVYKTRNTGILNITKIEKSDTDTRFYIHCIFWPKGWLRFSANDLYIEDVATGTQYVPTAAEGIEFNKQIDLDETGLLDLVLVFPPLPESVKELNWGNGSSWTTWGIKLEPHEKKKDGLPEFLEGNWLKTDGSNVWMYGFYEDKAVFDNRFWKYEQIKSGKRKTELTLTSDDGQRCVMTIQQAKKGNLLLQVNNGKEIAYSKERQPYNGYTNPEDQDFGDVFKTGTGYLRGYMKGYDPRLNFTTGIIYLDDVITDTDYPTVITFQPDGRFEADLKIDHPIWSDLLIEDCWIDFYIEPGDTLFVYLDWEDFLDRKRRGDWRGKQPNYRVMGEKGRMSEMLYQSEQKSYYQDKDFKDKIRSSTPEEFLTFISDEQQKENEKWSQQFQTDYYNPKIRCLLQKEHDYRMSSALIEIIDDYMREQPTETDEQKKKRRTMIDAYYKLLNFFPIDDPTSLLCPSYSMFINRYRFSSFILDRSFGGGIITIHNPDYHFVDYLDEQNIKLPVEDRELLMTDYHLKGKEMVLTAEEFANQPKDEYEEKRDSLSETKYKKEYDAFIDILVAGTYKKNKDDWMEKPDNREYAEKIVANNLKEWSQKDSLLFTVYDGSTLPLIQNISKIQSLDFDLKQIENRTVGEKYIATLTKDMKNELLTQKARLVLDEVLPENALQTYELPDGPGTRVFKNVIDKYKGKYLFVDFWATTCGPCIYGIKEMAEERKKFKDHPDFKFVYITSERDSPEKDYTKFVEENLAGEACYRLPQSDYNYLRELFRFNGIPYYLFVDKEGRIMHFKFSTYDLSGKLNELNITAD